MRLLETGIEYSDGRVRVVGRMEDPRGKAMPDMWFEYGREWEPFLYAGAEAFIPVMLMASMLRGEDLLSDLPVSKKLAEYLHDIQAIYKAWNPGDLTVVETKFSNTVTTEGAEGRTAGAFFSAGVDSFHTALREKWGMRRAAMPITHLIYMEGLETPLYQMAPGKDAVIREIAGALDFPVITGSTNLRNCFDYDYGCFLCGVTLASIGHSLSGGLAEVVIPSSGSFAPEELFPSATHAMVDPLWTSERAKIRQDGGGESRAERTALTIAKSDVALRYLMACTVNYGEFKNCGVCPKCVRTQIALQALGVLEKCATFESPFRYELIRTQVLKKQLARAYFADNLALARREGRDLKLVKLMERHLRRYELYTAFATLVKETPLHPPARWLREFVKKRFVKRPAKSKKT